MSNELKKVKGNVAGGSTVVWVLIVAAILIAAAFVGGYFARGRQVPTESPKIPGTATGDEHKDEGTESDILFWTCSMHPEVKLPDPGRCPKCHMELIPVKREAMTEELGARETKLSETAMALAEIEDASVERKFVEAEIRMVGKVYFDETRLKNITAWVPGRLDRLYVDYTGIPVAKGDHMVDIYSPELLVAQRELISAKRVLEQMTTGGLDNLKDSATRDVAAVREKLSLWGLTKEQIDEIEKNDEPSEHLTIYAPMGGIVIEKHANEGMYVDTGTSIYTIADLNVVWLKLDAYESDLIWLRYGQKVEVEAEAYPGRKFMGVVSFIDPVLDETTRTVKVRVNVDNADGRLKPGMFVRSVVKAVLAEEGKVMETYLAGKWICPMHPEIVKDDSGDCPICGMPLVVSESLGYTSASDVGVKPPLVIPEAAPLITGKRAVVYVSVPNKRGVYEGREVELGPKAGRYYIVNSGLKEGEAVVVRGNFKIDSDLQIRAKPSMMSPEGGVAQAGQVHGEGMAEMGEMPPAAKAPEPLSAPPAFKEKMDGLFAAYMTVQRALTKDDTSGAAEGAKSLIAALGSVDMSLLDGPAHEFWMKELEVLKKSADDISKSKAIAEARESFWPLSQSMATVLKRIGSSGKAPVFRLHCPMAFNNAGADWLQDKATVENPYFGSAMFSCGSVEESIVKATSESEGGK